MDPEQTLPPERADTTIPASPPSFSFEKTLIPRHVSWDLSSEELDEDES